MLKRIGLIGDLHAENAFPAIGIERLAGQGVDCVLAVGDSVDGRGSVNRCVEPLEE